jgi:hypothetical protein
MSTENCHCGADYQSSDHCPECFCEEFEADCGRRPAHAEHPSRVADDIVGLIDQAVSLAATEESFLATAEMLSNARVNVIDSALALHYAQLAERARVAEAEALAAREEFHGLAGNPLIGAAIKVSADQGDPWPLLTVLRGMGRPNGDSDVVPLCEAYDRRNQAVLGPYADLLGSRVITSR